MKNSKKGFTLIELLVVIAIIGILSAVVLASLSTARNKAQDAKVQGQLSSMRAAAEIVYGNQTPNGYGTSANSCAGLPFNDNSSGMAALIAGSNGGGTVLCSSNGTAWIVKAPLVSTPANYWCADSAGTSKTTGNNSNIATLGC